MELNDVYAMAQPGLKRVEAEFRNLIQTQQGFPELGHMLEQILVGGKMVRPTLTLLAGSFYYYDADLIELMATSAELMHIATLVHDDAIDSADMRRGRATINSIWGVDLAILLGDFLFARSGELAARTGNIRAVTLFARTLGTIARGEIEQAFSAFNLNQSFDQYAERIAAKTAALFVMATESGAVLSQAPEPAVQIIKNYGYNLGIAFQIVDDILDFTGTQTEVGKPVGADLAQGTMTLPSLLLLKRFPYDNPVQKVFRKEDIASNIQLAIDMIRNSNTIDECYGMAADFSRRACANLDKLPDKPARRALTFLAEYILRRQK
jgi:octaprenyl-diphosphate synthase